MVRLTSTVHGQLRIKAGLCGRCLERVGRPELEVVKRRDSVPLWELVQNVVADALPATVEAYRGPGVRHKSNQLVR
jgi:hypothetical protein